MTIRLDQWIDGIRMVCDNGVPLEGAALIKLLQDCRAVVVSHEAINTPEIHDFLKAVEREALHQRQRWGKDHDAGKTHADWFWLVGYLAGKALGASKLVEQKSYRGAPVSRYYRHVKRGTDYEVVAISVDENNRDAALITYRGTDDGMTWTRPAHQFFDGRFTALPEPPPEKLLHHIITTAAACLNWHAHALGVHTKMRPGIETPNGETA